MNRTGSSLEAILEDGNVESYNEDLPMKPDLIVSQLTEQLSHNDFFNHLKHAEEEIAFFVEEVQKLGSSFYLVESARNFQNRLKEIEKALSSCGPPSVAQSKFTVKNPYRKEVRFSEDTNTIRINVEMKALADSLKTFTIALADFEDYADEDVLLTALGNFEVELRVLSGGLEFFALDDFYSDGFLNFISARVASLKLYSGEMTTALNRFRQTGVPCISTAQKRALDTLMNASTIATLFAGVAATTIQYSIETHKTTREIAMNTLWLSSLVLAIGAAMMCMVAIAWKSAVFSSPRRRFSLFFRFWVRSGYLILLAASAISFLSGLIVYVFNAIPPPAGWVILALSIFCCLSLVAMLFLFFKERIRFSRLRKMGRNIRNRIHRELVYRGGWLARVVYNLDLVGHPELGFIDDCSIEDDNTQKTTSSRQLRPILRRYSSNADNKPMEPRRGISRDGMPSQHGSQVIGSPSIEEYPSENEVIRYQNYKDTLKSLVVRIKADSDLHVSHLQYSPDGKWLAVCHSHECAIFDVLDNYRHYVNLKHIQRKAERIEWSPNSSHLLSRTNKSIKLWQVKDKQFTHIDVDSTNMEGEISDVCWLNDNVFLVIVDKSTLVRIDIDIHVHDEIKPYKVQISDKSPLLLRSLCTSSNLDLIFIIAARKVEGLHDNASVERALDCIIVLELTDGDHNNNDSGSSESHLLEKSTDCSWSGIVKKRLPLSHRAKSLTINPYTKDFGGVQQRQLIISYADSGPEYWTLVKYPDHRVKLNLKTRLLVRDQTQKSNKWGKAYLIGPQKNIVSCTNDQMMYLWDIESGENKSFHQLKVTGKDEETNELPVISWIGSGNGENVPTMAIAGKNTRLKIWAPKSHRLVLAPTSRRNTPSASISVQEEGRNNRNVSYRSYELPISASPRSWVDARSTANTTPYSGYQISTATSSNESLLYTVP